MDEQEFDAYFRNEILPGIVSQYEQNGTPDYPARRETWNDLVDSFVEDGILPGHAVDWSLPDDLDD